MPHGKVRSQEQGQEGVEGQVQHSARAACEALDRDEVPVEDLQLNPGTAGARSAL